MGTYGKGGSRICEAVNKHFAVADDSLNDLLWMFILGYPLAWGFLKWAYNSKFHPFHVDFPYHSAIVLDDHNFGPTARHPKLTVESVVLMFG